MSLLVSDFFLPLLLKGLGWMALCGFIALCLPGSGRIWRTGLASLTLLSGLCLPPAVWTWYLPERQTAAEPAPAGPSEIRITVEDEPVRFERTAAPVAREKTPPVLTRWQWGQFLLLIWAGGTGGLAVWLAGGFLAARRWVLKSVPVTDAEWRESLAEECRSMGIRRIPRLLRSPVPGPCVTGCFRPAVLLPESCQGWGAETRRIVLRHELSHVLRGDARQAWIRAAALLIHWLNPLVWLAVARSRRAEELTADAAVLAGGVPPDRYAAVLLAVAASCQLSRSSCSAINPLLTAMAHPSTLEFRLRRILAASSSSKKTAAGPARFATLGAGFSLLAAGFIGCSAVEERGSNSDFLKGEGTPSTPIQWSELKKLNAAKPSTAKEFTIKYRVVDAKGQLLRETFMGTVSGASSSEVHTLSGKVDFRKGQRVKVEVIREFPYPTEFDPPQNNTIDDQINNRSTEGGSFPVTPTTPQAFEFRNVGWTLSELNVRPQGASLLVSGIFRETTFEGFVRNAGEAFSPITTDDGKVILTDNKVLSPAFSDRDTRFIVAALPGKSYLTRLNLKQPDAFLEITCEPKAEE